MTVTVAAILSLDGLTSGAIYALIALALLIVFTVTRVILVPQGQFVTYAALTYGQIQTGQMPGTAWLLVMAGAVCAILDSGRAMLERRASDLTRILLTRILYPLMLLLITQMVPPHDLCKLAQIGLTLAIVVPLGPFMYRLVFEPLADASVLILLIVSVAVDLALSGIGLLLFGSEGARTDPLFDVSASIGSITISGAILAVISTTVLAMLGLYIFFGKSVYGKSLRATAFNRLGAKLVGIRVRSAGRLAFLLASAIGAVSGILVSSVMTVYYDSGFMIGLKGFVAAIVGGLVSYPAAVVGAVIVGLIEAWSAFYASAFKEVIVFASLIPVLVVRSVLARDIPDDMVEE
jgi:branched-chain amino acid transport system permease protein